MNDCKACNFEQNTGEVINNNGDDFIIIRNGEPDKSTYNLATDEKHFYTLEINYCPMCGRKLR